MRSWSLCRRGATRGGCGKRFEPATMSSAPRARPSIEAIARSLLERPQAHFIDAHIEAGGIHRRRFRRMWDLDRHVLAERLVSRLIHRSHVPRSSGTERASGATARGKVVRGRAPTKPSNHAIATPASKDGRPEDASMSAVVSRSGSPSWRRAPHAALFGGAWPSQRWRGRGAQHSTRCGPRRSGSPARSPRRRSWSGAAPA
jgi:hypothetical protein